MSALYRTVAFTQMNRIALIIRQYLKLDMFWMFNIFFNIHGIVAKTIFGFTLCILKIFLKFFAVSHHTHAFSTTAKCRFYHDRITDFICKFPACFRRKNGFFRTRNDWNTRPHHCISGFRFISGFFDCPCRRTDKCNVTFFTKCSKFAVFR